MRALAGLCRRARHPPDQRRGLPGLLLRRAVRHARRRWNEDVLVVDGFCKAHAHDRLAAGIRPRAGASIQEMAKLQQFSFVCAPQPVQ